MDSAEWVGGYFAMPAYVTGEGEPYRPQSLIWLIPPDGLIEGVAAMREEEIAEKAGKHFVATTRAPMVGPPRMPARVRVASEKLARSIREQVGASVEILVAPTPEVDAVAEHMRAHLKDVGQEEEPSYLGSSDVTPELVAALFDAAADMFRVAPWKVIPNESAVFRVSVPELGVENFVMSVIGHLGESLGFVLFQSLDDLDRFGAAAKGAKSANGRPNVPPHFALNFDRGADMEPALRREIAKHGWKVAGSNAYPWLVAVDPDLVGRPPTAGEIVVGEALCRGLTRMVTTKDGVLRAAKAGSEFVVPTFDGPVEVFFKMLAFEEPLALSVKHRSVSRGKRQKR